MIRKGSRPYLYFLVLCINLLITIPSVAQVEDSLHNKVTEKWYETLNNGVTLKLEQTTDVEKLAVLSNNGNVYLSPNAKSKSKLSFSYKFITFKLNYIPKFLKGNDDDRIKGSSKALGFNFNVNLKKWIQELSYDNTKGLYLENTADYIAGWKDGDPYIQFPNLVYIYYQGVTAYKFNKRFSVNALLNQNERQLKSTGSFIPQILYNYSIIDDRSDLNTVSSSQKSNNFEWILSAGYYYNFVLNKKFYLAFGVIPGYGYVFTKLNTRTSNTNQITHQTNTTFRFDGRSGLGYNGDKFFTGISFYTFYSSTRQQNTAVQNHNSRTALQIFAGFRFAEPKSVHTISKKLGL